jgi:molybdopterin-guanine dinucleotide biosynthesis protein A
VRREAITLAVLAGGRGVRMGGPKSGLSIGGMPILQYLSERLAWPGPTLVVTGLGNEHPAGAERFDAEVTDAVAGEGPLRGVLTALEAAGTELVAVATVDMPGVAGAMIDGLAAALDDGDVGVMYARGGGRVEPFPMVIRRGAVDAVRARLAGGRRSVNSLSEIGVKVVMAAAGWEDGCWRNLNCPEDLIGRGE